MPNRWELPGAMSAYVVNKDVSVMTSAVDGIRSELDDLRVDINDLKSIVIGNTRYYIKPEVARPRRPLRRIEI